MQFAALQLPLFFTKPFFGQLALNNFSFSASHSLLAARLPPFAWQPADRVPRRSAFLSVAASLLAAQSTPDSSLRSEEGFRSSREIPAGQNPAHTPISPCTPNA